MDAQPELYVTVFSDYICPFCYIGDARLNRLRDEFDVRVNWCLVEIHPETPAAGCPVDELGYTAEHWRQMMQRLAAMAQEEQLVLAEHSFTANSHKALLLAEAAKYRGRDTFYTLHTALFEAFMRDQRNIGDERVLRELVAELGLDAGLCAQAWNDPQYEAHLQQYRLAAREMGVRATPTLFLGAERLDGAVSLAQLQSAARRAVSEQPS